MYVLSVRSMYLTCHTLSALTRMQSAKAQRESIGVELYGFQQTLAKLQLALEQTHQNYVVVSGVRSQAETNLSQLRGTAGSEELGTKTERGKVGQWAASGFFHLAVHLSLRTCSTPLAPLLLLITS